MHIEEEVAYICSKGSGEGFLLGLLRLVPFIFNSCSIIVHPYMSYIYTKVSIAHTNNTKFIVCLTASIKFIQLRRSFW